MENDTGQSFFGHILDRLESIENPHYRIATGIVTGLLTVGMWIAHLNDPSLLRQVGILKLFAAGIPFAGVMALGFAIFPETTESNLDETGPMSGYLTQLKVERRRKLTIFAFAIGSANLLLMLWTQRTP